MLGDILVRSLRRLGHPTEVQNYVDDTGVQVSDVVVGFLFLPEEELLAAALPVWPEVGRGESSPRQRVLAAFAARQQAGTLVSDVLGTADFDDLCWNLYPRVTRRYEADETFSARRTEVLHAMEAGFPPDLTLADRHRLPASLRTPDPGPRTPPPLPASPPPSPRPTSAATSSPWAVWA